MGIKFRVSEYLRAKSSLSKYDWPKFNNELASINEPVAAYLKTTENKIENIQLTINK